MAASKHVGFNSWVFRWLFKVFTCLVDNCW